MAYELREVEGAAVATTITSDITDTATTITIDDAAGWPDGATAPFMATLGSRTATEETIEVLSRSGTTLTLASSAKRGVDDTSASNHSAGTVIEHTMTKRDLAEANYMVTQLAKATTAEDLLVATGAAAFKRLAKGGTNGHALVMVAGAVAWAVVPAAGLGTDAVETSKIKDLNVTTGKLADDAVTYAKMQNVSATDRLLGRDTAAAGDVEELTVTGGVEFSGSGGIRRSALTGDVLASAGSNTTAFNYPLARGLPSTHYVQRVTDVGSLTTPALVTSLTLTLTLTSGRRYKIETEFSAQDSATTGVQVRIDQDSSQIQRRDFIATAGPVWCGASVYVTGDGTEHTFEVKSGRGLGSGGTITVKAANDQPAWFSITDVGHSTP